MYTLSRLAVASLAALTLSGCSVFGGGDEPESLKKEVALFQSEAVVDVVWSTSIGDGLGKKYHQFTPAVIGEFVFALDAKGVIKSLNKSDGKPVWSIDLEEPISAGVGAGFGQLFVATESGNLHAYSALTGDPQWVAPLSTEVVATPQVNSEVVVAQQINGQVIAFDRKTGEQRWVYDSLAPRLTLRGTATPVLTEQVTLAAFASGKLAVIRNDNGKQVWERRVVTPTGRSELERIVDLDGKPVLIGNTLYLVGYQGNLLSVNLQSAQVLWSQSFSSYKGLASGFGNIYAVAEGGSVEAYTQKDGAIVWRQDELEGYSLTTPVALGSYLAIADTDGYIHVLSQVDGRFVARIQPNSNPFNGSMLVADDVLYTQSDDGTVRAIRLN